jgi:predicted nucleotidyltransferase
MGTTGIQENLKAQLLGILSARPEVMRVILFGSRARGDAEERSDIDLAVEAPSASERQWLDIANEVEEADTLLKIDLVWCEQASPALKERIMDEGRILYERK